MSTTGHILLNSKLHAYIYIQDLLKISYTSYPLNGSESSENESEVREVGLFV